MYMGNDICQRRPGHGTAIDTPISSGDLGVDGVAVRHGPMGSVMAWGGSPMAVSWSVWDTYVITLPEFGVGTKHR